MLKRIQKDKLKKYRIVALLVSVYFLFSYFALLSTKPVFASDGVQPYYETSDIENDIIEFSKNEEFAKMFEDGSLAKSNTIKVISFLEYGFDEDTSNSLYSLFLYVYCPSNLDIVKNSILNNIQIGFTNDSEKIFSVDYEKLLIKFLSQVDYTKNDNINGYISKWKININQSNFFALFTGHFLDFTERIYCLSGIELLLKGNTTATEFVVGETYHMSLVEDEDGNKITKCSRSGLDTVEVETNHTFYRTGYSEIDTSNKSGWQTQISSCYFSLPKYLENKYGVLTTMDVEFENKYLTPMLIVQDERIKEDFDRYRFHVSGYFGEYPYFYAGKKFKQVNNQQGFNLYDIYFNSTSDNLHSSCYVLYNRLENTNNSSDMDATDDRNHMKYLDLVFYDPDLRYQNFDDLSDYYFSKENIDNYLKENYFDIISGDVRPINYWDKGHKIQYSVVADYGLYRYFDVRLGYASRTDGAAYQLYERLTYPYIFESCFNVKSDYKFNIHTDIESYNVYSLNKLGFDYNTKIRQQYAIDKNEKFTDAISSLTFKTLDNSIDYNNLWGTFWKQVKSWWKDERPYAPKEISPIVKVNSTDFYLDNDVLADKYCVDKNEVPALKEYALSQQLQNNDVYLLRYDICEYYCAPADIVLSKDETTKGVVARQSAYLNFDVIQFGYMQDGVYTVIPANHSPVNVFNSITGQENVDYSFLTDLLSYIMLLLLAVAIIVVIIMFWPFFKLVFSGAGLIIKGAFKIVFLPAKIIFRKRPKNDDD